VSTSSSNLDQLRAIAVVAVMIDHLVPTLVYHQRDVPQLVRDLTQHIGHAGVLAFFVHTSLVLMYSLERMEVQKPAGLVLRFYIRRWFRIYPLALVVIVGVLVLGLPNATWRAPTTATTEEIIANLFLVQNLVTGHSVLVPLWSLPYEVQMYLLLPALFLITRRHHGARLISALLLTSYVAAYALYKISNGHMNFAGYAPCFLSGVLCYTLRDQIRPTISGRWWPVYLLGIIGGYCYLQLDSSQLIYWLGWLYAFVLGISINAFVDCDFAWLNRLCLRIATYSYGLYLLHVPMLYVVYEKWNPDSPVVGLVAFFALSVLAAVSAYHLVEEPMVALGRRLTDSKRQRTPVS
jgi:peptidoglycan/LPS O-acetylase OafA/YrhL